MLTPAVADPSKRNADPNVLGLPETVALGS